MRSTFSNRVFHKHRFSDMSTCYDLFEIFQKNDFWSGMPQKCFWSIWDYSGPIPAYPGPIMDQNRLANNYRSEGLPLRDMLSLGAWRMGLGCSGKILPPPPPLSSSSSPSSPKGGRTKEGRTIISYIILCKHTSDGFK